MTHLLNETDKKRQSLTKEIDLNLQSQISQFIENIEMHELLEVDEEIRKTSQVFREEFKQRQDPPAYESSSNCDDFDSHDLRNGPSRRGDRELP